MHADRLVKTRKTRHYEALHQRAPAFINLPIPDNIPVLGPLLDGLNPVIGAEPSDGPWSPLIDFGALKPTPKTTHTTATQVRGLLQSKISLRNLISFVTLAHHLLSPFARCLLFYFCTT